MATTIYGTQHHMSEWSFQSSHHYQDAFNDIELSVVIVNQSGQAWRIPAFWAGGDTWRVRFTPPASGIFTFRSDCNDTNNQGLHHQAGQIIATQDHYPETIISQGTLRVSANRRNLENSKGQPFFWLGDTWWMGLCSRLKWPEEFQTLTYDRHQKGFSVIQIVAGLYPDMPGFDPRGANEAGFPWEKGYERINPAYFDMADLRISWLVRSGIVPCIVAAWGYYLKIMGIKKMKRHWRYLIARWGCYPVIWCLAGEATMPYYLSEEKDLDRDFQKAGWTEVGRYVRETDPFHHPITIHPTQVGRDQVNDDSIIDINMLQTGHGGTHSLSNTISSVDAQYKRQPTMPVLVGEVSYEGFLHYTGPEIQRLTFWSSILSGSCGHTYGANGIWQVNSRREIYGASPHGGTWGNTAWEDAYFYPGSAQLGMAKKLLERYEWQQMDPHPDWVDPSATHENFELPFAAGVPMKFRMIYFYGPNFPWDRQYHVKGIESGIVYQAYFWDPRTGQEFPLGIVIPDESGRWQIPVQPELSDWVLVMERTPS